MAWKISDEGRWRVPGGDAAVARARDVSESQKRKAEEEAEIKKREEVEKKGG